MTRELPGRLPTSQAFQETVYQRLWRAMRSGQLGHTLLFQGQEGVGKLDAALWISRTLNCENRTAPPCDSCPSCIKIQHGTHPDILILVPEVLDEVRAEERRKKNLKPRQVIPIERVRELEKELSLSLNEGAARIVILNPADTMDEKGLNALLKILEEPPQKTHFILITARPNALLQTIQSRSQSYSFQNVPPDIVMKALREGKNLSETEAHWLSFFAGGSLSRAESLDPEAMEKTRRRALETFESLGSVQAPARITALAEAMAQHPTEKELLFHKQAATQCIGLIQSLMRDMLYLLDKSDPTYLIHRDLSARLREVAAHLRRETLIDFLFLAEDACAAIAGNADRKLVFEDFFLKLHRNVQTEG